MICPRALSDVVFLALNGFLCYPTILMADPLSATASILTLIGPCTASAKTIYALIQSFRHVSDELSQLSNEVNDLNLVLTEVEVACRNIEHGNARTREKMRFHNVLSSQVLWARLKLKELDDFTKSLITVSPTGNVHVNGLAWLRKRASASKMVDGMRRVKSGLHLLLETHTV